MRRPVRWSLRTPLIAVAVVGLVSGSAERRGRFRSLAAYHEMRVARGTLAASVPVWIDGRGELVTRRLSDWHEAMRIKYRRAAARPWLPVGPDPPPPPPEPLHGRNWRVEYVPSRPHRPPRDEGPTGAQFAVSRPAAEGLAGDRRGGPIRQRPAKAPAGP